MGEKRTLLSTFTFLTVYCIFASLLGLAGQLTYSRFMLALFPLLVVLVGVAFVKQSGLTMALVGLGVTAALAVFQFGTPVEVVAGSSVAGFLSSFGISISVAATMLMIFLMKEAEALATVSKVIKQQMKGNEIQALYIGIGFGSFLTSLGVVTPALFPPLLMTMGFSPTASIAIAVLGYDPTTSFSLLAIPITLPASIAVPPLSPIALAFKIALFLPMISVGFAFGILWLAGGKQSMKRGLAPALVSGLALALTCLGAVSLDFFTGIQYIPLRVVGVVAGLCAMLSLHIYQKLRPREFAKQKTEDYPSRNEILRSFSPWIILTALAVLISIPQVGDWLANALGNAQVVKIYTNQPINLKILSQIYTWIFVTVAISLFTLRMTKHQILRGIRVWLKRFAGPFFAYSIYFSIAYVMSDSAKILVNGALTTSSAFEALNMNIILGSTLAAVFGVGYIFVAASLGLFGAIVGGSETSSNVLFLNIQQTAAKGIGIEPTSPEFLTLYGSHAVAGGIASAVTPAKINNAVVTIDAGHGVESQIMRKHLIIALLLTVGTGILTGVLVTLGI